MKGCIKAAGIVLLSINMLVTRAQSQIEVSKNRGGNSDGYKLIWADEFNKHGRPDPTRWRFENGFVRNRELQWYQPDNAWCDKGMLIIEARKETKPNPGYDTTKKDWRAERQNIQYTAASLNTRGLHQWKYGRFEMRGKIDVGPGLWPAFWTLGVNGEWPSNGEIDIMEYYKGKILANIATGTAKRYDALWFSKTKALTEFNDPRWADKFHIWRMDWDENAISLFVDDALLNRVDLKDLANRDGSTTNPFKQPHYVLLNFALGGDNGGPLEDTVFPKRFQIDYVRIYQKSNI
jgi:beta-glucanase (GH16 family)